MLRLLFVPAGLALVLGVATGAVHAQSLPGINGVYIQAYGGLRVPDNLMFDGTGYDLGIGTSLGASVGVDTSIPGLSAELDYLKSSASYSGMGTTLDSQSLMVDGVYGLPIPLVGLKPYVGAGLGAVNVTYKSGDSGTGLGYQLKAGVQGSITDQLSWFGEYRYQQAASQINVGPDTVEYANHSIVGGLKLSFGTGGFSGFGGGNSYGGGGTYSGY
jgi:opacity protein-like surface antigen